MLSPVQCHRNGCPSPRIRRLWRARTSSSRAASPGCPSPWSHGGSSRVWKCTCSFYVFMIMILLLLIAIIANTEYCCQQTPPSDILCWSSVFSGQCTTTTACWWTAPSSYAKCPRPTRASLSARRRTGSATPSARSSRSRSMVSDDREMQVTKGTVNCTN